MADRIDVACWQADDLQQHGLVATVACIRASAHPGGAGDYASHPARRSTPCCRPSPSPGLLELPLGGWVSELLAEHRDS